MYMPSCRVHHTVFGNNITIEGTSNVEIQVFAAGKSILFCMKIVGMFHCQPTILFLELQQHPLGIRSWLHPNLLDSFFSINTTFLTQIHQNTYRWQNWRDISFSNMQPMSTTSQTPSISLHASTYQPFAGLAIPNQFPFCSLQPSSSLSSSHPLHDPCQFPLFPLTTLDSSIPNSLCASTTFPNHLRMAPMGPRLQTWKSRHSPSYPTLFTPSSISLTSMPVASMTSQSRLSSLSSLISDHMSIPAVSPQPLALSVFGLDSFSSAVKGSALISSTVPNPNSAISFKSQVSESYKSHWLFAGPSFNWSPFIFCPHHVLL